MEGRGGVREEVKKKERNCEERSDEREGCEENEKKKEVIRYLDGSLDKKKENPLIKREGKMPEKQMGK